MDYDKAYYQDLIYGMLDVFNYTADTVLDEGDEYTIEDFADAVSGIIMEFGKPTPEIEKYLEKRDA